MKKYITYLCVSITFLFFSKIVYGGEKGKSIDIVSFQMRNEIPNNTYNFSVDSKTLSLSKKDLMIYLEKNVSSKSMIIYFNATDTRSSIRNIMKEIEVERSKLSNVKTYYVDGSGLGVVFQRLAAFSYACDGKDYIKIEGENHVINNEEEIQKTIDEINKKFRLKSVIVILHKNSKLSESFVSTLKTKSIDIISPDNKLNYIYKSEH